MPFLRDIEKLIRQQIPSERRTPIARAPATDGAAAAPERPSQGHKVRRGRPEGRRSHNGRPQQNNRPKKAGSGQRHRSERPRYNQSERVDDISGINFLQSSPEATRARSREGRVG
jgi:hypothetical protein